MIKASPLPDSLQRNVAVEKNGLAKSSTQLSLADAATKPEEAD
jgi:hypothetical protein